MWPFDTLGCDCSFCRSFWLIHLSLQIGKLQDDNKALDRLTKSKEAALLDAEKTVQSALAKASMVDDLQNKNQELMKQIEICQVSLPFKSYNK